MIKVTLDWDKAHNNTHKVITDAHGLVELDKDGACLRVHSVLAMVGTAEQKRPATAAAAPQADFCLNAAPVPCAPAAPSPDTTVELNQWEFTQLLATLKSQATTKNMREDQKLTLMEVHEKLLAMKK